MCLETISRLYGDSVKCVAHKIVAKIKLYTLEAVLCYLCPLYPCADIYREPTVNSMLPAGSGCGVVV